MTKKAKTIVHVNQHLVKHNKKHGTQFPVLTVKHRGKTYYGHEVLYHDFSKMVYQPSKPLSCGATCWVETEGNVTLFDWTAIHQEEHPSIKQKRQSIRRLGDQSFVDASPYATHYNSDMEKTIEA